MSESSDSRAPDRPDRRGRNRGPRARCAPWRRRASTSSFSMRGGDVGRGDDGLPLADEDAQAEIAALGALELLRLAQPLDSSDSDALSNSTASAASAPALRARLTRSSSRLRGSAMATGIVWRPVQPCEISGLVLRYRETTLNRGAQRTDESKGGDASSAASIRSTGSCRSGPTSEAWEPTRCAPRRR